ncbi:PAS domain-containing protein [Cupriavidus basilensis]
MAMTASDGHKVVGAGRWLASQDMGLVVELHVDEAYQSYFLVRTAIVSLTAIAIGLILALAAFQRRARRSVCENEERTRAFSENVPTGLAYKDLKGVGIMANRAYEQAIGVPYGAAVGCRDWDIIPESPYRGDQPRYARTGTGQRNMPKPGAYDQSSLRL